MKIIQIFLLLVALTGCGSDIKEDVSGVWKSYSFGVIVAINLIDEKKICHFKR